MKRLTIAGLLAVTAPEVHADAFELKNLEDFETCMHLDEMLVTETTGDGSQSRWLGEVEIQVRWSRRRRGSWRPRRRGMRSLPGR